MATVPAETNQGPIVARPTGNNLAVSEAAIQRDVAEVQAAMMIAKRFPRDQIAARDKILQACTRPSLAEVGLYEYARGGSKISGPSIRLAEAMAQSWGNLASGVTILSSDTGKSECIAYARDLETNYYEERRFSVKHWRDTRQGGYQITEERDIYELAANMGARRKRACILAVIPGDVVEDAVNQIEITLATTFEVTPDLIKSILAAFEKLGVSKEQIEKRIQRHIDAITPAQVGQLKKIQTSIKEGVGKSADYFEAIEGDAPAAVEGQTRTQSVKEKVRAKAHVEPQPGAVVLDEDDPFAAFTDEAKALLAMDKSKDEAEGSAVLDRCKGQPFRARIVAAYNAKFPNTIG